MDHWIRNIKDTYALHKSEIDDMKTEVEKVNRLVELNVVDQVKNIVHTSIIQQAWKNRPGYPILHGWVYDLANGRLKPITSVNSLEGVEQTHRYAF
ncbi:MAG: hypothetical protein K2X47_13960 [Bdellovibrionales bacterium]|nr:hypothetical protein [Bdellovibrionales bacterium]